MDDVELPSKDFSAKGMAGYLVVGFGALLFLYATMHLYQNGIGQDWSTTTGTITKSWLKNSINNSQSDYRPEDRTDSVLPSVEYEFEVDGNKYKGNRWAIGRSYTTNLKKAKRKLAQYPVGKRVPVYYSPKDPGRSILRPSEGGFGLLGMGLLILVIGVIITQFAKLKARFLGQKSVEQTPQRRPHASPATIAVDPFVHRNEDGPSCPRCDPPRPLSPRPQSSELDCAACDGRLLREQDVDALLKDLGLDSQTARDLMKEMGVPVLGCPACRNKMHQGPLRGSVVDLCLSCGAIWLDAGELRKAPSA